MASTDEVIHKLILKIEGEQEAKKLGAAIALAEQKYQTFYDTLGKSAGPTKAAASALAGLQLQLKKLQAESGLSGHKMMQFGNIIDDMQYVGQQGLRPIINNIMQLSPALGVALIAAQSLYNNWDLLVGLFGKGHVKTQAEEMEELRQKTSLTADEAERLSRASALKGKVDELRAAKTKAQQEEEKAATEAMVEAGAGNVARGILKAAPELVDSQGTAALAKEELARAEESLKSAQQAAGESDNPGIVAEAEGRLRDARERLVQARKDTAEQIAATGALPAQWAGQRAKIQQMAAKDPAAFGGGDAAKGMAFAKAMDAADPEAAREKAEDEHFRKEALHNDQAKIKFDEQGRIDEEEEDRKAEEHARKEALHNEQARSKWEFEGRDTKEVKKQRDDDLKAAKDSAPGIEELIRSQLKASGSPGAAAGPLAAMLRRRFGGSAEGMVEEQLGPAREELMSDFVKGPDRDRRNSRVIGAEGLADSIQSAVGGDDTARKQLEQLERQTMLLNFIANQRGGGGSIAFDASGNLGVR